MEFEKVLEAIQKDFTEREKRIENIRTNYNLLMHDFINNKYDKLNFNNFCDIIEESNCLYIYELNYRDIDGEVLWFKCKLYNLYLEYGIKTNEMLKYTNNDESIISFSFIFICYYIKHLKEKELKANLINWK